MSFTIYYSRVGRYSFRGERNMSKTDELKKQIGLFIPRSDWKLLTVYSVKTGIPMSRLILNWIEPELKKLRERNETF